MAEVIGVVEKVSTTFSPAGSARKWTKKSFLVNSDWYGGFVNADNKRAIEAVNEGDSVKIGFEQKGEYKNLQSISVLEEGQSASTKVKVAQSVSALTDKDFRITYLASRKDAIEFVKTGLQLEMFDLGKKKATMADIFFDLVNEYASKFAMVAMDARPEEPVTKTPTVETKAVNE